ncbi:MAG: flagellar biosynthesis anti-sigma factor FlgM [Bdellovibrionales bacterium]|nr:flagellar biosynthesis anti-sigma factor FlgM [Bdellovibrionales bacterium]
MKTDKINRLIQALGKNSPTNAYSSRAQAAVPSSLPNAAQQAYQSSDAVKVQLSTSSASKAIDDPEKAERQKKIDRIKAQVDSGTYTTNSSDVAKSFVEELAL